MNIPDRVKKATPRRGRVGCPIEGCGSPYLTYHFDPPRRIRAHDEPAGMVASCRNDRTFRRSVFLLDGFEFENCDFDECVFALRVDLRGLDITGREC